LNGQNWTLFSKVLISQKNSCFSKFLLKAHSFGIYSWFTVHLDLIDVPSWFLEFIHCDEYVTNDIMILFHEVLLGLKINVKFKFRREKCEL